VIYLIESDFSKPLQLHATIMEYETKTQMTETHVQTNLRWDPTYIRAIPGLLKLAGITLSLVCHIEPYISVSLGGRLSWQKKCSCPGVLCLRDGGPSSLEGTAYWGVVHFYCNDCLLGFPYIVGNVLGARNRKVPCHPLADDRVRLLCALVLLLLYSSSCFCSEGERYTICENYVKHGVSNILWHGIFVHASVD